VNFTAIEAMLLQRAGNERLRRFASAYSQVFLEPLLREMLRAVLIEAIAHDALREIQWIADEARARIDEVLYG